MDLYRTVIGAILGDGDVVASLPLPLRPGGRRLSGMIPGDGRRRLNRALRRLLPRLRLLEASTMPAEARKLQEASAAEALADPQLVERGWAIFQAAWQAGLIVVLDLKNQPIPHGGRGEVTACSRLTMAQVEKELVTATARTIFADNEGVFQKIEGALRGLADLPKLRILAEMDSLRLEELREAFGHRFESTLFGLELEQLSAIATLSPHALHALRQAMGRDFLEITRWEADHVRALSETFQVVEQYRDLGPYVIAVTNPQSIRVIGQWDTRDITERVNAARIQQGKERLKGRRYETDIAVIRHVMGKHFEGLLERPPELLDAIGRLAAATRLLAGGDRADRVEQLGQFAERYLDYLTTDTIKALRLTTTNPRVRGDVDADPNANPSFGEVLRLLDGLWNKKGFGRLFFEGPFQTPKGAKAMAGLVQDFLVMKQRGSVKGEEVEKILSTTELLDRSLRGVFA
ncbi:hypothetical protein [Rhodospirillum rubrum]|uniref:Uncharacterized protein n=1 Tax=Rhodospirillum rubrum (strain ATCC 11170 / ATH 1.1.1 / DSM 467 / LMG 4362 / NCIMB 8255 / S1) TaxID=269796 RepID=Q2RSZ6_RHORT|nr:hypothetical protein [Rhodospirillum rubrum]ABC22749.1 hypothetical protein Rru_A1949 [Rhodospirillum rubrum ATCC 11170]AEO48469.1 hypothetical protein F11_10015 [Rhodospirillum rubrum F11]MBK5954346.1 hypothetical protein [Rhodospirillum rubrum]QXG78741.1 hypothetical protein KUL73_10080 [Rhodospirillum rubrum]HCF17075.1 hypothetical protein [Rhodospirillum rubrum]